MNISPPYNSDLNAVSQCSAQLLVSNYMKPFTLQRISDFGGPAPCYKTGKHFMLHPHQLHALCEIHFTNFN